MKINENIKRLRELNKWSQEEMAERVDMSKNGYAKIERGEVQPSLSRLKMIAEVFDVDIVELFRSGKSLVCLFSENSHNSSNYYSSDESLILENEKLKMEIQHKNELMDQQQKQIMLLEKLVKSLS